MNKATRLGLIPVLVLSSAAAYAGVEQNGGTWNGGTWNGGTWNGGTWNGGTWNGGTWNGGVHEIAGGFAVDGVALRGGRLVRR